MKIIFFTIGTFSNVNQNGAYTDLLRCFKNNGNNVYVVCSLEHRTGLKTSLQNDCGIEILRVRTGNITKTRLLEKGISTVLIGWQYKAAIKKYFNNIKFDLVLYSTPPITLLNVVRYIKNRDKAFTYLLLKDIFPQNAVDIGILSKKGIRGLVYGYFKTLEKKLYLISDKIGCMSIANAEYIKKNNPYLHKDKVEVCPNTIDLVEKKSTNKAEICTKYGLPEDRLLFLYGGNFGKPQNVDYIISVLKECLNISEIHFVMCGSGTDFYKLRDYTIQAVSKNITVIEKLGFNEYTDLVSICDVGLIFLDYRFTIPNFPSRILDYMNYSLPVFAATDKNTDVGSVIVNGGFGWWCESSGVDESMKVISGILQDFQSNNLYLKEKGNSARKYLEDNYTTDKAYNVILRSFKLHSY